MNITDALFYYRAVVVDVYDGDTITVHLDLGLRQWNFKQKLRLYGIDAPELRGEEREEGLKSRDRLRELIPVGSAIYVRTYKDKRDSFGRWLAVVIDSTGVDINQKMIADGFAVPYEED